MKFRIIRTSFETEKSYVVECKQIFVVDKPSENLVRGTISDDSGIVIATFSDSGIKTALTVPDIIDRYVPESILDRM